MAIRDPERVAEALALCFQAAAYDVSQRGPMAQAAMVHALMATTRATGIDASSPEEAMAAIRLMLARLGAGVGRDEKLSWRQRAQFAVGIAAIRVGARVAGEGSATRAASEHLLTVLGEEVTIG